MKNVFPGHSIEESGQVISLLTEIKQLMNQPARYILTPLEAAAALRIDKNAIYPIMESGLIEARKFRAKPDSQGTWKIPYQAIIDFQAKLASPDFPANFPAAKRELLTKYFNKI